MKITILGTEWTIKIKEKKDDPALKSCDGYADHTIKEIVVRKYTGKTESQLDDMNMYYDKVTRHEIIHAFLYESGLAENSSETDCWARNEEMVDWFAIQGPKIYKAWQAANVMLEVQE